MPIKNAAGLNVFLSLQKHELGNIADLAALIPRKIARLLDFQDTDPEIVDCIVDSVGMKIHDVFTGTEAVFQKIAKELDGYAPSGEDSHAQLVRQMSNQLNGRPPVISMATSASLDTLRSFRHFLRHDYGAVFDQKRVIELGMLSVEAACEVAKDFNNFCAHIEQGGEDVSDERASERQR